MSGLLAGSASGCDIHLLPIAFHQTIVVQACPIVLPVISQLSCFAAICPCTLCSKPQLLLNTIALTVVLLCFLQGAALLHPWHP
jgi:hypothetical protein